MLWNNNYLDIIRSIKAHTIFRFVARQAYATWRPLDCRLLRQARRARGAAQGAAGRVRRAPRDARRLRHALCVDGAGAEVGPQLQDGA